MRLEIFFQKTYRNEGELGEAYELFDRIVPFSEEKNSVMGIFSKS